MPSNDDPRLQPDIESAIVAALRADATLSAATVATRLPANYSRAVVIAQASTTTVVWGWLWRALIDVHSMANGITGGDGSDTSEIAASALAAAVELAFLKIEGTTHLDAVIAGVDLVVSHRRLPDPTFTPTRPRYISQLAVNFHPVP